MTGLHSIGTSAVVPSMLAGAPVAQSGQMSDPDRAEALREAAFARMSKSFPVNRGSVVSSFCWQTHILMPSTTSSRRL
jgi:hypothetical protein